MAKTNTNVPPKIIKETRKSLGYTQLKSATILGYSRNAWRAWERGTNPMRVILFNKFLEKTQQPAYQPKKEASMTPQEAILKQSEPKTMKSLDVTQSQKDSMAANRKIFWQAFEELSAVLENYKIEAKEKIARDLFGENGTMRTRKDPEANGMRSAIRKHVRGW